jgi:transcriptional regulator with XRE-family HTH domain
MSQVVFAERCGFYQTYLSRIENGHANPSLNAIEVIANALGLSVFDMFELVKAEARPAAAAPAADSRCIAPRSWGCWYMRTGQPLFRL